MKILIQSHHFELTQGIKDHIQRKLQFAFSRMERHITVLSVCLSDVNGPKGGPDKRCRLHVCLANMENVVVRDTQTDLYCAIDRAMHRASRSVARKISRQTQQLKRSKRVLLFVEPDQDAPSI